MRHRLREMNKQLNREQTLNGLTNEVTSACESMPTRIILKPSDKDILQFCSTYYVDIYRNLMSHLQDLEQKDRIWLQLKVYNYATSNDNYVTSFAGKALVLIYTASKLHDERLWHEGIKWYIKALKKQQVLLRNIRTVELSEDESLITVSDGRITSTSICRPVARIRSQDALYQTIMASFIFTALESLSPSSEHAMIGPQIDEVKWAFELFEGVRMQWSIASIALHQDSFLSSPEWMNVPFKSRKKDDLQVLIDMMLEFARIQQQMSLYLPADYVRTPFSLSRNLVGEMGATKSKAKVNTICELYKSLKLIERNLDEFFEFYKSQSEKWHARVGDPKMLYDRETGTTRGEYSVCLSSKDTDDWSRTHFFKPPIEYFNVDDCYLLTMYYAVRSLVGTSIMATLPFMLMETIGDQSYWNALSSQQYRSALEAYHIQIKRNVSVICRSSKYVMTRDSIFMLIWFQFPVCVAYDHVTNALERQFIRNLLEDVRALGAAFGTTTGLGVFGLKFSTALHSTPPNQYCCSSCGEILKELAVGIED
ncbi:hypothetical protein V1511DRAFT_519445 [Dipodascopsis uninucleata]